jgi:hypothetical protein
MSKEKDTLKATPPQLRRLVLINNEINRLVDISNKVAKDNESNIVKFIYHGEPFFVYRLFELYRELPKELPAGYSYQTTLEKIRKNTVEPEARKNIEKDEDNLRNGLNVLNRDHNYFNRPINGISLAEIDNIHQELSLEDIKKIQGIMADPRMHLFNRSMSGRIFHQRLMMFAIQKQARDTEKIVIPQSLQYLYKNLTASFNHFASLWTDFSLSDDHVFKITCYHLKRPLSLSPIIYYLPAHLGISPSSVVKLFAQRLISLGSPDVINSLSVKNFADSPLKYAYPKGGLPDNLIPYTQYDQSMDQKVEGKLNTYYSSIEDEVGQYEEALTNRNRLKLYRKVLNREIMQSPNKTLPINLSGDYPFGERMIVTKQYKDSLMFIIFAENDQSHLTLEIGKDDQIYGLPPNMLYETPNLKEVIVGRLIHPLLQMLKGRNPAIEPRPIISRPISEEEFVSEALYKQTAKSSENNYQGLNKPAEIISMPERKRKVTKGMGGALAHLLLEKHSVPEKAPQAQREFTVIHSRTKIRELLGKKVPEDVIDTLMEDIKDFEFGRSGITKRLKIYREIIEVKSGQYRIFLSHKKGKFYTVEGVGHKQDLETTRRNALRFR